jgi:hypothetical protein
MQVDGGLDDSLPRPRLLFGTTAEPIRSRPSHCTPLYFQT